MTTSEIMKQRFNFWKGIAVAAVLSATAVGYAEASKLQTATHYNATPLDAEDQTPRWEPIVPGSPQDLNPCTSSTRHCKAVQISPGMYNTVAFGYL